MEAADEEQLAAFLKETLLTLEVAITDTPRQTDPGSRREKFEGTIVYTTTVPNTAETVQEQIEGQWYVSWNVSVPISKFIISIALTIEHGRTKISNPRVALTAILSLSPSTVEDHDTKDDFITAESWKFLSGQMNLLAPLANDPTTTIDPVLPLSRIISAGPTQSTRSKPGRRICRHIFPCGSPLDIRMRYNPLEPDDNIVSAEIVLLSVDLSVTPHANASVLVKEIKVEMGGGTVTPLQDVQEATLRRYDVLTLLYRYERYGGEGGRKTVSTSATMIPLLSNSAETSPQITSLWNKILDIPNLNPLSQMAGPTQRAVSQIMTPPNSARHSPKPSITGKPRVAPTHGRAQTVIDLPTRPIPSTGLFTSEPPNLSITVQVPSKGVNPNEEFAVEIQVVNRANRPMKLALHVDSGQAHFRSQSRGTRTDKLLPRVPMSATLAQPTEPDRSNVMTEAEVREYFMREHGLRKGKPIVALTVEGKIGYVSTHLRTLMVEH